MTSHLLDSQQAWLRLIVCLVLITVGSCGMYVVVVVLPAVQAEFGITRADASLPYTLTMIGFGLGGIMMGRWGDKVGVAIPVMGASIALALGFIVAGWASSFWMFALAHGVLIGFLGCSSTFSPLVTEISFWFQQRRGIAVAIAACGNYFAGALWPPITQAMVEAIGWRQTYVAIGIACVVIMFPLALWLQKNTAASRALRASALSAATPSASASASIATDSTALGIPQQRLLFLLCVAGVGCCVAMSMPQVHIVAYCSDLGFGVARGAQMLSLMLAFGIASRLLSGLITDRIGGLRTLLLGSALQCVALFLFLPFNEMESLFVVSALFGLFQGGIVPSYAIIVREYFSPARAGAYVGTAVMATMFGMALGGWVSGKIFDYTGSYNAAFLHGIAWNLLNMSIAIYLLIRARRMGLLKPLGLVKPRVSS